MTRTRKQFSFFFRRIKEEDNRSILVKDEGVSVTEFALVAPFFIILLFAAIQIGLLMVVQNALEAAAREAARYAITGQTETGISREAAIKSKVLSTLDIYSGGMIKPVNVIINVKAYPDLPSLEEGRTPVSTEFQARLCFMR